MSEMNAVFITARTDSSRLPNKALIKILGRSTIERLIDRVKKSKEADKIILCTTTRKIDDALCDIATQNEINFYRGSLKDKLERWNGACKRFDIDYFATADGDDLFCEPDLIDKALCQLRENQDIDFIHGEGIACGAFTPAIRSSALNKICRIKDSSDTEMMWVYFTETGLFNTAALLNVPERYYRNDVRMTLDYKEDLTFFSFMIEWFESRGIYNYNLLDIISLIDKNPNIPLINIHLQDKWKKNQEKNTKLKLKKTPAGNEK